MNCNENVDSAMISVLLKKKKTKVLSDYNKIAIHCSIEEHIALVYANLAHLVQF